MHNLAAVPPYVKKVDQRLLLTAIIGLTGGIFLADCLTPLGFMLPMLYGCPVYISGWLSHRRTTVLLAGLTSVLTVISIYLSPPGGLIYVSIVNRSLAIASIWLAALLTLMHKRARGTILAQRQALEDLNANLEQRVIERTEELRRTMAEKERFASELMIASQIQRSILPRTFPPFPARVEFEIYAESIPAWEMGGDFYDFFLIDAERLGFVIADVSGKGVPAAIYMAVTRSLLKATALRSAQPDECLRHVNGLLCPDNDSAMFTTVFYGILDTRTGEVTYSNAGHHLPYLLRGAKEVESVVGTGGMAIGVMEDARFDSRTVMLKPGDRLFLYTDGITEAMDGGQRMFSAGRLREFLEQTNECSPAELIQGVVTTVRRFTGGVPQSDDITALALRYRGGVI